MPLRNQRKKPWCKLGFTTVQEAEESQQRPEITQLRIVGREDFSPCLLEILARQTYLNCRSCHIQFTGIALHQLDPLGNAGQTHLNSDATIGDEGRPQGAPLPIVFSGRYALGRAPTRGAPTRFRQPHVVLSQLDAIALLGNPLGLPRNCEMWYIEPTTPTATACQVSCNCLPIIPLATLECESRKERRSIFSRLRSVPSIMVQCTTLSGQGRPISRTRAPFPSQFHPHWSTSTFFLSAHGAGPFRFADARRANPMHGLTTDGLTTEGLYQCW